MNTNALYRTPADPGGFPFGYNWRATLTGLAFLVCAEHVRQLGGVSPLHNLMEVK